MDRENFELEVAACYGTVLRGLIAASGRRDQAEDALHDALVAAMRDEYTVAGIVRVDAWLYAVGVRKLRRSAWREGLRRVLGGEGTYPEPGLERIEVTELLALLTPRQRAIVVARYYLGLSYKEIASVFAITVGTATTTVSQALRRMQSIGSQAKEGSWKTAK